MSDDEKKAKKPLKNSFFRIDTQGGLAPANPEKNVPKEEKSQTASVIDSPDTQNSQIRNEPVFNLDEENRSGYTGSFSVPIAAAELTEIEEVPKKNEVNEDISKLKQSSNLSQEQSEILKKYISIKEKEVSDLREQLKHYQSTLKKIQKDHDHFQNKNRDLIQELQTLKRHEEQIRIELKNIAERHHQEVNLIKNDYEDRILKSGNFKDQMQDLLKQKEEWKDRVSGDLKRIKLKEKELENKYELLKRDTQTLLDSKDKHVLELKKKNDALELELETLEERLRSGNSVLGSIEAKKRRLVETMKLAISLLEDIDSADESEEKKKTG